MLSKNTEGQLGGGGGGGGISPTSATSCSLFHVTDVTS